jgi:hypothetical protein
VDTINFTGRSTHLKQLIFLRTDRSPLHLVEKFANILLVLTIQTVMPVGFTILVLYVENKQRNQRNGASRFKEKCLRKAQHYLKEEKALAF